MPFISALSTHADTQQALAEVIDHTRGAVTPADLAVLFYSPHHQDDLSAAAGQLRDRVGARWLLGCPGETIVGGDREIEQEPALALWLARWSSPVRVTPFHLTLERTPDGDTLLGWPDDLVDVPAEQALVLTLADPFTFPVDDFLEHINDTKPGLPVVGGMASGAQQPGQTRLLHGDSAVDAGAIGVVLQGALGMRSVVSQGCRPIGKPFVITKAERNAILELGGKPVPEQLQELWQQLNPRDQELVRQGLHLGVVMNEYQGAFQRGDFLVRNVLGLDRSIGALVIGAHVRVGQTVQLHVRDASTADEDLRLLLQHLPRAQQSAGALLFSCNGRGTRLFDTPHHDARVIQELLGPLPLAGFFAQGELGPIGPQNFIHGFTASLALFQDAP
jgi:small ligand-binding sensory domain FIST